MTPRPSPAPRSAFAHFQALPTRWMDNDVYGHVNNVVHYSLFDTAVNRWLIEYGALDIQHGGVIGLVVETRCNYFASIAFPQTVHAGLALLHQGTSSVRYAVALFADAGDRCAALGEFVHVYADRATRRPVHLPAALRQALASLPAFCHPSPETNATTA